MLFSWCAASHFSSLEMFGWISETRSVSPGRCARIRFCPQRTGPVTAPAASSISATRVSQRFETQAPARSAFTATIQTLRPGAPTSEAPWIQAGCSASA